MLLTLDSSNTTQTSNDFTIEFSSPLNVRDSIYEISLIKTNLWYSFYNISATYNNNTFNYTNNASQVRTITITPGNYTITQINNYMQGVMLAFGDYTVVGGINTFDISFLPDYSTLRVQIVLANSYSLDFTTSNFCLLLGWVSGVYNFTGTQSGLNVANINNGVNTLQVHCDIISGSYQNSILSDVLYSFVPNVAPGSNIQIDPKTMIYLPIKIPEYITKIRMYITDQLNRSVNFNGEPITYLLHLRRQINQYMPSINNF